MYLVNNVLENQIRAVPPLIYALCQVLVDILIEVFQTLSRPHTPGLVMLDPVQRDRAGEVFVDPQVDVLVAADVDADEVVGAGHHLTLVVGGRQLRGLLPQLRRHAVPHAVHQTLHLGRGGLLVSGASAHPAHGDLQKLNHFQCVQGVCKRAE